jgi:hypothetical protein
MNPSGNIIVSRMNVYSILESFFFREADAVIANTDAVSDLWNARYPTQREKFHVIWNGFDPSEVISPTPIPQRNFKHLVHVGELYGGRHPGPILASLQRLISRGVLKPCNLRLSLIGPSTDSTIPNINVLKRLMEIGVVEYLPKLIPKHTARTIACEADALLLLQPQSDVQVPAKLFEYIRIGRPVLAFIRRNSPNEHLLSRSGIPYRSLYPDDPPQEIDAKMLEFLSLPSDPVIPSKWFTEQFNARHQAEKLSTIIDTLSYDACLR